MASEVLSGQPYRLPERTAVLVFEDGELRGAEIRVRLSVPIEDYFEVFELVVARSPKAMRECLQRFGAAALIDWNVRDAAGEALPADATGLMRIPFPEAMAMLGKWLDAVRRPPASLAALEDQGEPGGE